MIRLEYLRPTCKQVFSRVDQIHNPNNQEKVLLQSNAAFAEFLTQGYVIPLWQDYTIKFEQDGTFKVIIVE